MSEQMRTYRGKPVSVPVSFFLPWPAYEQLVARATGEGKSLSAWLRAATERQLSQSPTGARHDNGSK